MSYPAGTSTPAKTWPVLMTIPWARTHTMYKMTVALTVLDMDVALQANTEKAKMLPEGQKHFKHNLFYMHIHNGSDFPHHKITLQVLVGKVSYPFLTHVIQYTYTKE